MKSNAKRRLIVERATGIHISPIVEIARERALANAEPGEAHREGFFVSMFCAADYLAFLQQSDHFYVMGDGTTVSGFLMAFSSTRILANSALSIPLVDGYPGPYVLIKQVAVRRESGGKGIADYLYDYLFTHSDSDRFFAAIVIDPLNERSISFHEKHGFRKIGEYTPDDRMLRGLWMRDPQQCH